MRRRGPTRPPRPLPPHSRTPPHLDLCCSGRSRTAAPVTELARQRRGLPRQRGGRRQPRPAHVESLRADSMSREWPRASARQAPAARPAGSRPRLPAPGSESIRREVLRLARPGLAVPAAPAPSPERRRLGFPRRRAPRSVPSTGRNRPRPVRHLGQPRAGRRGTSRWRSTHGGALSGLWTAARPARMANRHGASARARPVAAHGPAGPYRPMAPDAPAGRPSPSAPRGQAAPRGRAGRPSWAPRGRAGRPSARALRKPDAGAGRQASRRTTLGDRSPASRA